MDLRGFMRSPRPDTELEQHFDKLPSDTLKRHPRMDLNKGDMLQLLSYLEGELQARDIVIAALRMEKTKHLLYHAKCGHFGQADALYALQRDSDLQKDNSFGESAVKSMYDDQLIQLENLITTQHTAQHRMREQLTALEKCYHKMCAELDEEKLKHARDLEQGDNVTYILEKDRERLKQELEFEKTHKKKMEKELKKLKTGIESQKQTTPLEHKEVAIMLIKEQTKLMQKLGEMRQHYSSLEFMLAAEQQRVRELQETLAKASQKSMHVEAAMEKRFSELDFESEQIKSRIAKAEQQNCDLIAERGRIQELLAAEHNARESDSAVTSAPTARHLHGYVAERTLTPTLVTTTIRQTRPPPGGGHPAARQPLRNKSPGSPPESKSGTNMTKALLDVSTVEGGNELRSTVTNLPRKVSPIGRTVPPPIPPNKPQMQMHPGAVRPVGDLLNHHGRMPAPGESVLIAALSASNQPHKH